MAHIDIHFGYAVNGVAALHTEILKESELKPFYDIYPEKFNNKTNGITFRRWLMHCNHNLAEYLKRTDRTGISWRMLQNWKNFWHIKDDEKVLAESESDQERSKNGTEELSEEDTGMWRLMKILSLISRSNVSMSTRDSR